MRSFTCPACGANLTMETDNRVFAFCNYCGAKILLDDYRSTHHRISEQRSVDETEICRIEAEKDIMLKQMDLEQKEKERKRRLAKIGLKVCLVVLAIGIILFIIGSIIYHFTPNPEDWNGLMLDGMLIAVYDLLAIIVLAIIYFD